MATSPLMLATTRLQADPGTWRRAGEIDDFDFRWCSGIGELDGWKSGGWISGLQLEAQSGSPLAMHLPQSGTDALIDNHRSMANYFQMGNREPL